MSNFFNRNTTAKIISILFAVIMWTYVMGEINPVMPRDFTNVPVELLNVEELREQGLVIVGDVDDSIRVTLRGRRDEVFSVNRNDVSATVDLRGARVGVNNLPIDVAPIGNLEISVSPRFIRVELEEVISRQKEVSLIVDGRPATGHIISEPQFKPSVVWVEGPASAVNSVDRVIATLEVSNESKDIIVSLPLKAVDSAGMEVLNVDIKAPYIDVLLPIERMKSIDILPQVNATAAEGYQIIDISVIPQQIALRGPQELINNITEIETEPIVFRNLTSTVEKEVALRLPEEVSTFNEEPIIVRVIVEAMEEKVISVPKDRITFTGIPEGYQVELNDNQPEVYEVKIRAMTSILNRIDVNDIQLVGDLSNDNDISGNREVELKVNIPRISDENIYEATVNPKTISIKLIENNQ